jgi:CDP-diacylglycerol--serine O-phosphatidyltransferase
MKQLRTVAVFPTLFTLANLVSGFLAIVVAARIDAPTDDSNKVPTTPVMSRSDDHFFFWPLDRTDPTHNLVLSSWLIFLAMFCDVLDGRVARLTRQTSDFGGQLDSLSDIVSFGVAPAFLMVKMCPSFTYEYRQAVWFIAALFAICAALRLARFNVENSENDKHLWFGGLPTPAGAAGIAGFALLFYTLRKETQHFINTQSIDLAIQYGLPVFVILVSLLMVSRVPYPHIVSHFFRGRRSFPHLVGLIFAIVPVLIFPSYAAPILTTLYILAPPGVFFWQKFYLKRRQHEPVM